MADKTFLVTIGDRSVGGMISRDPLVGPWQVPVSDVGVTVSDYFSTHGEAMAMGERTPLALLDAAASGRMAVAEAVTNIIAADVRRIEDIRLSANWMAACGEPGEDADLYDTVRAIGEEFCPALGLAIPVGKDSLSMKTAWTVDGEQRKVVSPVSLIVSAFAPVEDVRRTTTPQLRLDRGATRLLRVDLGGGRNRLGGSCLAQVYGRIGSEAPDCADPAQLRAFVGCIIELRRAGLLLAYHDRSDGGLLATLAEMAFAGRCGVDVRLAARSRDAAVAELFTEELGAVVQVESARLDAVRARVRLGRTGRARARPGHGRSDGSRGRRHGRRRSAAGCFAHRAAHRVVGDEPSHAGAARQPGVRRRGARARRRREGPGPVRAPDVRPGRGHRRALTSPGARGRKSRSCASRA